MQRARKPVTTPRKQPVQARSEQMVRDILKAAVRVLSREGAQRFTTIRVAEAAGVSVGSLYQYFPNKQAILMRLQTDEWSEMGASIDALLGDASVPPARRLRATFRAFFRSECAEAPLRSALDAAIPNYHDHAEERAGHRKSQHVVRAFVLAAAPHATSRQRSFAADLLLMTMTAVGKQVSERGLSDRDVDSWADATADMVIAHLATLRASRGRRT